MKFAVVKGAQVKFKFFAIPWWSIIFLLFMTGRRNRAQTPSRFLPPRPSPPFGFIMDQKRGYRGFQASANSHIIQCEHHLVAVLFVCGKFLLAGIAAKA